jgi:hypothetical protein
MKESSMIDRMAGVLLAASCLLAAGEAPRAGDRPEATLAALGGGYRLGDELSRCFLTLWPDGRFSFYRKGGVAVPYRDVHRGGARLVAGHLILTPEEPNERTGTTGMDTDLVPVRWGDRLYLVPAEAGRTFCNGVNMMGFRSRPDIGTAYLREGDEAKMAGGLPEVPKEWEPMLLKAPFWGEVVDVLAKDRARIDFGGDVGAWKGLVLWVGNGGPGGPVLFGCGGAEVVEVGAKTCVIELKGPISESNLFRRGQKIYSRHPFADRS